MPPEAAPRATVGRASEALCREGRGSGRARNDVKNMDDPTEQPTEIEIAGRQVKRVRYGEEQDDWGADRGPCHDCGVQKGELHIFGCHVERCPICGGQVIFCECD